MRNAGCWQFRRHLEVTAGGQSGVPRGRGGLGYRIVIHSYYSLSRIICSVILHFASTISCRAIAHIKDDAEDVDKVLVVQRVCVVTTDMTMVDS